MSECEGPRRPSAIRSANDAESLNLGVSRLWQQWASQKLLQRQTVFSVTHSHSVRKLSLCQGAIVLFAQKATNLQRQPQRYVLQMSCCLGSSFELGNLSTQH